MGRLLSFGVVANIVSDRLPRPDFFDRKAIPFSLNGLEMAEITPSSKTQSAGSTVAGEGGADPFATLFKMSTTAGIGAGSDYVAVNSLSVVAVLLGLGSSMALLDKILLIVPVAGVIFSILALRQIARSNGTQTGMLLATGGLVLSLAFTGVVGGKAWKDISAVRQDKIVVSQIVSRLDETIRAGNLEEAYALFSPKFTARVPLDEFKKRLTLVANSPNLGKLKSITWNGIMIAFEDPMTESRFARCLIDLQLEKAAAPSKHDFVLRDYSGKWQIEDLPSIFPSAAPGGPPTPGGVGPGGPPPE